MAETTSREKVAALLKQEVAPKDIAEQLDMSVANVYAHKRKIEAEAGQKPRGRGRPPKVEQSDGKAKAETKAEGKPATRPAPGTKAAPVSANGRADEFPHLLEALDSDLAEARKRVTKLEKMREALVG